MVGDVTLADSVLGAGRAFPQNGFWFQSAAGLERFVSFESLEVETAARAAAISRLGLRRGDRLGLIIIDPESFVLTFLGALRAGVVPVPLYPPAYLGSLDLYVRQTQRTLAAAGVRLLMTSSELENLLTVMVDLVPSLERVVGADLRADASSPRPPLPRIDPDDTAFLQYTSGSTDEPKGVIVTHRMLTTNIEAFTTRGLCMDPRTDVGVSWLPLYHDMGLIGFALGALHCGVSAVFIPTLRFVRKVSVWMDAIHRHRGTVSFAPNFAFALAARQVKPAQLESWDLSCLRALGCAAEPIDASTVRNFVDVFKRCRLGASALAPAYGLAEATLAVSMKSPGTTYRSERIDSARFQATGEARLAGGAAAGEEHVSCGVALPGTEIAIRRGDRPCGPAVEGEIVLRGPAVATAYFNADGPHLSASDHDGWLHTGDLGYLREGELHVTGRIKDLIILNGRNIHPQLIERAAATAGGVRRGNVVAFSRPGAISEELVVVAEARGDDQSTTRVAVADAVADQLGFAPTEVVCVKPGTLPKTSSGKLQRQKVRRLYLDGRFEREQWRDTGPLADSLDVAHHVTQSESETDR
jgi:fatty-acyl-CoA synthase